MNETRLQEIQARIVRLGETKEAMRKRIEYSREKYNKYDREIRELRTEAEKLVTRVWRFEIKRAKQCSFCRETIYEGQELYTVAGILVNRKEVDRVADFLPPDSGMNYIVEVETGYMKTSGGGTTYFQVADPAVRKAICAFLKANPEGGDITSIVEEHRNVNNF